MHSVIMATHPTFGHSFSKVAMWTTPLVREKQVVADGVPFKTLFPRLMDLLLKDEGNSAEKKALEYLKNSQAKVDAILNGLNALNHSTAAKCEKSQNLEREVNVMMVQNVLKELIDAKFVLN